MDNVLDVGCFICRVCKVKKRSIKKCVKCHRAFYCSRECQIEDWPTHRSSCQQHFLQTTSAETRAVSFDESKDADCCVLQSEHIRSIIACKLTPCEIEAVTSVANFEQGHHLRVECNVTDNNVDVNSNTCIQEGCSTCVGEILTKTENSEPTKMDAYCHIKSVQNEDQVVSTRSHNRPGVPLESELIEITVRCGSDCLLVSLRRSSSSEEMLRDISSAVKIIPEKLRLISSGKQITSKNLLWAVGRSKPIFLAIGEKVEDEDGLDPGDISVIMKQLTVERNVAVRALKQTNDLVDAILHIGNK